MEGIENLYESGSECEGLYARMLEAYQRLCIRLGGEDEDADVEIIISSLRAIERVISFIMYEYGSRFGMDMQ